MNSYKYYIHDRKGTARIRLSTSLMCLAVSLYTIAVATLFCETAGALTEMLITASLISAAVAFVSIYTLKDVRNSRFAIIGTMIGVSLLTLFFVSIAKNSAGHTMNISGATSLMTIITNM